MNYKNKCHLNKSATAKIMLLSMLIIQILTKSQKVGDLKIKKLYFFPSKNRESLFKLKTGGRPCLQASLEAVHVLQIPCLNRP